MPLELLGGLLGLLLGVLFLLAMPFDVGFRLKKDDSFRLQLTVAWAYGLLSKELDRPSGKPKAKKAATKKSRHGQARDGKGNFRAAMAFMRSPGMSARLLRLVQDMWQQIRVRQLSLHLTVGLDDPAATGRLFGALAPALLLSDRLTRLDLQLEPDFSQPILQAEGGGQIRLIPITIIGIMVAFLLSPASWRALVVAVRAGRS